MIERTRPAISLRLARIAELAADADVGGLCWLSSAESARLQGIRAPRRRVEFVAGRWALRQLLAARFGGDPRQDWVLDAPPHGPPQIRADCSAADIQLALSHSGDWLACAVSTDRVGLDLEAQWRRRELNGLIGAVCTPSESRRLSALDDAERWREFHVLWTLKEAWLKQAHRGLDIPLMQRLETCRCSDTSPANARVWQGNQLALALVGPVDLPLDQALDTSFDPNMALHWAQWSVVLPTASA